MTAPRSRRARLVAPCATALAAPAWAQEPAYTYVTFSLGVPWAMYFFFLVLVTVPFVVMISLAWRQRRREEAGDAQAKQQAAATPPVA